MYPCDYNGRKLTLSSASGFSIGDVISQTLSISSLTAAGNDEEGYTATATVPAHGVATGETFKATIATTSATDQEHWEGEFVCVAASATTFTYTLNKPFDAPCRMRIKLLLGELPVAVQKPQLCLVEV